MPTSISIAGPAEIAPDSTAQFTSIATYPDGTTGDVTSNAAWTASDPAFVRSVGSGRYAGVAVGEGRANVNYRGRSSSKTVVVVPTGTFKLSGLIRDVAGGVGGVDVHVVSGTGAGLGTKSLSSGRYSLYATLTGNFNYHVGNATFPNGNPRTCPADSKFEFRR